MNDVQVGRYSAILHKLLDISEGAPVPSLAPEMFATLPLEVERPEWQYLGGVRLGWGTAESGPTAGEMSHVQIRNLAGSGMIATLERVLVSTPSASSIHLGHLDVALAGPTQAGAGYRDGRLPRGTQTSSLSVWYDTSVGSQITSVLGRVTGGVNTTRDIPLDVVLTPGTGFCIACITANVQIRVTFFWRERALEPQESR